MSTKHYEKTAEKYEEKWRAYLDSTKEALLRILEKHSVHFDSVFDYGGGTGAVLASLCEKNPDLRAFLYDPSEEMREKAKEKFQDFTILEQFREDEGLQVDLAITTNTLHHFEVPEEALRELASAVKPGGYLYLSDYSKASFMPRYFEWFIRLFDDAHVRSYTKNEARALLKKLSDFQILESADTELDKSWSGYAFLLKKEN